MPRSSRRDSIETAAAEVVSDDDVGDGVEHKLDVVGVSGTRLVTVNLLRCALVLRLKLRLDVGGRLLVHLLTCTHTHIKIVLQMPALSTN
jgi:hypothetical protein